MNVSIVHRICGLLLSCASFVRNLVRRLQPSFSGIGASDAARQPLVLPVDRAASGLLSEATATPAVNYGTVNTAKDVDAARKQPSAWDDAWDLAGRPRPSVFAKAVVKSTQPDAWTSADSLADRPRLRGFEIDIETLSQDGSSDSEMDTGAKSGGNVTPQSVSWDTVKQSPRSSVPRRVVEAVSRVTSPIKKRWARVASLIMAYERLTKCFKPENKPVGLLSALGPSTSLERQEAAGFLSRVLLGTGQEYMEIRKAGASVTKGTSTILCV